MADLMTDIFRQGGSCLSCLTCNVESLVQDFWTPSTISGGATEPQSSCDAQAKVKGLPLPCLSANGAERLDLPALNPAPSLGQIVPSRYLHGGMSHPESFWRTGRNGDTSALLQHSFLATGSKARGWHTPLYAAGGGVHPKSTSPYDNARGIPLR